MDNLRSYEVGEKIEKFSHGQDGYYFDITDGGAVLMVLYNKPSDMEISAFQNPYFEMRYINIQDILLISAKVGGLEWGDSPYSPHLSIDLTEVFYPEEGKGLTLLLLMIDSSSGEIKAIRLIGLSNKFSTKLMKEVETLKNKEFDLKQFDLNLAQIYNKYSTRELVKLSTNYCRLN